ncbi:MAG: glutamate--tRNA ligase [Bacilli bacterium]|jgi:glutamyl-tRNA synthetase|nr:glutamate--tRNA ligase [Bacilli bacterium]
MTRKEFANILVPGIMHNRAYYEELYPERNLNSDAKVVRIGPSPTGFVHFGTLFQAQLAHNLAKNSNGVFYVRIEDTDQKRETETGIDEIIEAIKFYEIPYTEGPLNRKEEQGEYGPYIQSKRHDIYGAFVRDLIEKDLAYPSFITPEELDELRHQQEISKVRIGYYGRFALDRNLPMEEALEKIKKGEPYVIRMKSPGSFDNKITFDDMIKGRVEMPENDIDHVILKGDGLPTYHFAHVVDDYLMHTTHVVRGDEWLSSLPIHIQLASMLNIEPPKYAHTAPIMKEEDGKRRKISKRKDPEANVFEFKKQGFPIEAVKQYLMTVINSNFEEWFEKHETEDIDSFQVTFEKMNISGALFDMEKIINLSKNFIAHLSAEEFYNRTLTWAKEFEPEFAHLLETEKENSIAMLNIERGGVKPRKDYGTYGDVYSNIWYIYDEKFNVSKEEYEFDKIKDTEEISNILKTYIIKYYDETDEQDIWFDKMKQMCDELGYASNMKEYKQNPEKFKGNVADISTVIRVAISSKKQTPNLYDILKILGKEKITKRFEKWM